MEQLLKQVKNAKTKVEKQELSAQFIAEMPTFLQEMGDIEQKYSQLFRECVSSEGTKSGAELIISETPLHKEYKYKKRLYDMVNSALSVLNMYTGS